MAHKKLDHVDLASYLVVAVDHKKDVIKYLKLKYIKQYIALHGYAISKWTYLNIRGL